MAKESWTLAAMMDRLTALTGTPAVAASLVRSETRTSAEKSVTLPATTKLTLSTLVAGRRGGYGGGGRGGSDDVAEIVSPSAA